MPLDDPQQVLEQSQALHNRGRFLRGGRYIISGLAVVSMVTLLTLFGIRSWWLVPLILIVTGVVAYYTCFFLGNHLLKQAANLDEYAARLQGPNSTAVPGR